MKYEKWNMFRVLVWADRHFLRTLKCEIPNAYLGIRCEDWSITTIAPGQTTFWNENWSMKQRTAVGPLLRFRRQPLEIKLKCEIRRLKSDHKISWADSRLKLTLKCETDGSVMNTIAPSQTTSWGGHWIGNTKTEVWLLDFVSRSSFEMTTEVWNMQIKICLGYLS